MKTFPIILAFAVLLNHGCTNGTKELSNAEIFHVDIDNITETIDLKLSDLADSFELIKLETTSECVLGNNTSFYVGDQYILAISNDGIYKFTIDGRYISKLINQGRGPQEFARVSGFLSFFIDEKTDYLYLNDPFRPQRFFVYDLVSETFLDQINVGLPVSGSFATYNDSLLICSYSGLSDSISSAVLFYDFKGELRSEITHNKMAFNGENNSLSFQRSTLKFCDGASYLNFWADDTLYQISNYRLIPYIVPSFTKPRIYPPNYPKQIGDRSVSFEINAPCFSIIRVSILEKVLVWGNVSDTESSSNTYFLNKNTGTCSILSSYTDDLIGEKKERRNFAIHTDRNQVVCLYFKDQIEKAVEKGFMSNAFGQNIIAQMYSINESMDEMDNPVLLVGKLKKRE
jgi:hypothetical protein